MVNFAGKFVGKIETRILWSLFFFDNPAICEIIWKNIAKPDKPQTSIRRMRFARWITEATYTHTHTYDMRYLLHFHDNNGYVNVPQCYVYIHNPLLFLILMAEIYLDQLLDSVRC